MCRCGLHRGHGHAGVWRMRAGAAVLGCGRSVPLKTAVEPSPWTERGAPKSALTHPKQTPFSSLENFLDRRVAPWGLCSGRYWLRSLHVLARRVESGFGVSGSFSKYLKKYSSLTGREKFPQIYQGIYHSVTRAEPKQSLNVVRSYRRARPSLPTSSAQLCNQSSSSCRCWPFG